MVGAAAVLVLTAGCMLSDAGPPVTAVSQADAGPFPPELFPEPVAFDSLPQSPRACLSEEEMAATEMVRVHTMLMVTGLTCHGSYRDPQLFSKYQDFTETHQQRIRDTQSALESFLGRHLPGHRARLFDSFRTQVANGEAMTVMEISAPRYCLDQRNRFYTVVEFDPGELDDYIDQAMDIYRETYTPCDEPRVAEAVQ
jgi:hypothetical protein